MATLVTSNPSGEAPRSKSSAFFEPALVTRSDEVMYAGAASSTTLPSASTLSTGSVLSRSEIWKVSLRLGSARGGEQTRERKGETAS